MTTITTIMTRGEVYILSLIFTDPPGQPVIEGYNPNGYAEAGESLSLKCISSGGNPTANLKWFRGVYNNYVFSHNIYHIYT